MEATSENVLNVAHRRRKLLIAFGKRNDRDPVEQEATNGHRGMIEAYLVESSTGVSNPN